MPEESEVSRALDVEGVQASLLQVDMDWVVLGLVCYLLAGLFMLTSIGRGRPRTRAQLVLGLMPQSLEGLRHSVMAKGRGQCSASFFVVGTAMQLAAVLLPGQPNPAVQFWGSAACVLIAGLLLFLLDGHVNRVMRSHLRTQLRKFPFEFEANIVMTREIGDLFGVEAAAGETLEAYCQGVRKALGIADPARGGRRPGTF